MLKCSYSNIKTYIDTSIYKVYTRYRGDNMYTTIQKWGNSQGIRLPKVILEMANLSENDTVELTVENGKVIITPVKKHRTLEERIAEYEGDYKPHEWDIGPSVGKEV